MPDFKTVVIGRTGRGDWGHAIDELFVDLPGTELVAVADESAEGLAAAAKRLGLSRTFSDWRRMLDEVRPEIVAICMRHVDSHAEMAIAAAKSGAKGIFMEKPFVRSKAEADAVIAACTASGTKLSSAFVNRHSPTYAVVREMVDDGRIGRLLEFRGRGKEDKRGGGEDLWVLGSHLVDMMADLGGAPQWCQANVTVGGRQITERDFTDGPEGIGMIAGDRIDATWGLADGVLGHFSSVRDAGLKQPAFGLTLVGSTGAIHIRPDYLPHAYYREAPLWRTDKEIPWQAILPDGSLVADPSALPKKTDAERTAERREWARRAAADLVDAIEQDREPETGMYASRTTVLMTEAVFASAVSGSRVPLDRTG
jgi:predicted dehydrogenase